MQERKGFLKNGKIKVYKNPDGELVKLAETTTEEEEFTVDDLVKESTEKDLEGESEA